MEQGRKLRVDKCKEGRQYLCQIALANSPPWWKAVERVVVCDGVSRQAVGNRLRAIEAILGRPLPTCAASMEAALRLDALQAGGPT